MTNPTRQPRVVWMTPLCATQRTQQSQSRSRFHRIQRSILVVFLWLVKQDWCEAILEQMWGFDESWSWRCFLRVERTASQWQNTWMSVGVTSLMERSLQNPGTSFARIDVGQICCVHDDVFMIILIKLRKKKLRSTHRNWSKQL